MRKNLRWLALGLSCLFVVPNYFCYDNPAAIETYIESELNLDSKQYGLLYSIYAIPNTILPLIGGLLLDKLGVRVCLIFFSLTLCLGQGVFMLGGYRKDYRLMMIGRGIFGIGCESMYVG